MRDMWYFALVWLVIVPGGNLGLVHLLSYITLLVHSMRGGLLVWAIPIRSINVLCWYVDMRGYKRLLPFADMPRVSGIVLWYNCCILRLSTLVEA